MSPTIVERLKSTLETFKMNGRALVSPEALGVLYPATTNTLKWVGAGFAAGAAYVSTPELHGAWALAAAVTTGGLTRVGMTIAEDVVALAAAGLASTLGHKLSGNHLTNPEQRNIYKTRVAIIAGTTALAVGGIVGVVEGGRFTYDVAKPIVAHFVARHSPPTP